MPTTDVNRWLLDIRAVEAEGQGDGKGLENSDRILFDLKENGMEDAEVKMLRSIFYVMNASLCARGFPVD